MGRGSVPFSSSRRKAQGPELRRRAPRTRKTASPISRRSPGGGATPRAAPAAAARCAAGRGGGGPASRAFSSRLSGGGRGLPELRQPLLDGARHRVRLEAAAEGLARELVVDPLIIALGGGLLLHARADAVEFPMKVL